MRNGKDVDPELMKKMNDKLSHRGPDGSAIWFDGPIGLGHQMLWTTPESLHEKLPFEENGLVITADARIDNRDELSKELDIKDEESVSDSYFILKAYEMWGDECPDKLLGDFAFAIWDKAQEKLFCARDHMGVKPFYYYLDDDMFIFGTEIKALFCVDGVPRKLDEKRLALSLLVDDFTERERTFYKDIKSFIAAHYLILDRNNNDLKRYWKLDPNLEIKMGSDEEYAEKFLEIFTEAVKCRLRSADDKIGVMLSGGLDSSSIACTANKILEENNIKKDIQSFSFVFDDYPEADEREFLNKVLEKTGIAPHFMKSDDISPLEKIDEILDYLDQPTPTFQIGLVHEINQILVKNKMRVLLAGDGGDQVVSHAQNYIEELIINFKWIKAYNALNDISRVQKISKFKLLKKRLMHIVQYYLMKWPYLYQLVKKEDFYENLINNDFLKNIGIEKAVNNKKNSITCKDRQYYLVSEVASQSGFEIADQNNSKFHIESRYPFFDKRMIEFCYAIPTEMKIRDGITRYIMRLAMKEILPKEVCWRTNKAHLSRSSLENFFKEEYILENVFNDPNNVINDYIFLDQLKNIYECSKMNNSTLMLFSWKVVLIYLWILRSKLR